MLIQLRLPKIQGIIKLENKQMNSLNYNNLKFDMKNLKFKYVVFLIGILCLSACKDDQTEIQQEFYPDIISLPDLRALYKGSDYTFEATKRITGVVISSTADKNNAPGDLVIQNLNTGITISFDSSPTTYTYKAGDSISVTVKSGTKLSRSSGILKLTGINALKETAALAGNRTKVPTVVTAAELSANFAKYESTLVKVTGNISPTPAVTDKLVGSKNIVDATSTATVGNDIYLNTLADATFSNKLAPTVKATYTGIAVAGLVAPFKQIRLQKEADVVINNFITYPNFPEGAEFTPSITKQDYELPAAPNNKITFKTGVWILEGVAMRPNEVGPGGAGTSFDTRNGANAFRFPNNNTVVRYLQMDFDLAFGASKVTFQYAHWNNTSDTRGGKLRLEYSVDQGVNWLPARPDGTLVDDITVSNPSVFATATYTLSILVPVRFRIAKVSTGTSSAANPNGRLNIDDITISY
jgi:hypothetical protein